LIKLSNCSAKHSSQNVMVSGPHSGNHYSSSASLSIATLQSEITKQVGAVNKAATFINRSPSVSVPRRLLPLYHYERPLVYHGLGARSGSNGTAQSERAGPSSPLSNQPYRQTDQTLPARPQTDSAHIKLHKKTQQEQLEASINLAAAVCRLSCTCTSS